MPNKLSKFRQDKSTNCFFKVDIIRCVRLTIFIFLLSFASQSFSQSSQIDSLKAILPAMKEDTSRVKLYIEIEKQYRWLEMDSSYAYLNKAIALAERIDAKGFLADALTDVGINLQIQGKYDSSIHFFQKSFELATEMGDRKRIEIYYAQAASLYHDMGLYDSAIANYFKCLTMAKERGTESGQAWLYNHIGVIYYEQGLFDESVRYYLKALVIREKQGFRSEMAAIYNNLGEIYRIQDIPDKALGYYGKAISINEELVLQGELEQYEGLAINYNNMGQIYFSQDSIDQAKNYYLKALKLFEELGLTRRMAESTQLLGDIHLKQGNYELAREYYSSARELYAESEDKMRLAGIYVEMANLEITVADSSAQTEAQRIGYYKDALQLASRSYTLAREMDLLPIVNDAANALMKSYNKLGDHKNGMKWAMVFIEVQDSMYREDKIRAIHDMNTKYETEKKQQQIELQESQIIARDATIKQQKTFRNSLLSSLGAIIIIVFLTSYAYIQKRKDNDRIREKNTEISEANEELTQLNEEINVQKEEIETQRDHLFIQNEAITSSINYAQRIQSAMLPPESYISELLNENFILYKPRDIVSGDFYWIKHINQYIILIAADCTGHGVPGALMSMLGISHLNEIVHRREITQAKQILNELRKRIKFALRQHGQPDDAKDGIDMALCVLDSRNMTMQYSGANNPLYLIRDEDGAPELKEIKADRMPIGFYHGKDRTFINHDIQLEIGDTFYLFTDGFIDQKGGKDNKKFMSRRFKSLLLEINDQSMYDQKDVLNRSLKDWMGKNSQMDDILVIGVRV